MSLECWQEVINDYEKLLENERGYDVIICVDGNEEIRAHSLVLSTRSQYFCTKLSEENVERRDGKIIIKRPDISSKLFNMILRFIYCGRIDFTAIEGFELIKLSIEVDDLNIRTLFPQIEDYLIKNQSTFLYQNTIEILETIYQRESFTKLWNFCLEKIYKEPKMLFETDKFVNLKAPLVESVFKRNDLKLDEIIGILSNYDKFNKLKEPLTELLFKRNDLDLDKIVIMLFNSDKFINLKAPLLKLIIERDDLILEEIDVWNSLLKWGLAQNPTISQDSTKWNDEEIKIIERTLHGFIPLVRFYYMSPEDFLDKIFPLKELLPRDLLNDLLTFHITLSRRTNVNIPPPRQLKIDSAIIQPKHIAIFAAAFHAKCDNKGATIVVAKIQNSELIVGGYNPLHWDSNGAYRTTKDSFIFSFTDRNDLQTAKVGYINHGHYSNAIYCHQSNGPTFGNGHDLIIHPINQNSNSNQSSYSKIDIAGNFRTENYELTYFRVQNLFTDDNYGTEMVNQNSQRLVKDS
uniref:Serine-enriched protein n=1 Tax=Rhizophagus irregularis (strain DAOM 181602 / DAOM 197198 / MUCL 43194) TaxID=747089 RepID=U9U3P6_RHIID